MTTIPLADIREETLCQPRATLDADLISEYQSAMHEDATFPPLTVFTDGETTWLADGFHRLAAASRGIQEIACDVRDGTMRDAILYAVQANAEHGKRRSNLDKRRAVEILLRDDEWSGWSNYQIAKQCAVSEHMVRDARSIYDQGVDSQPRTVSRNGSTYAMQTAKIGQRERVDLTTGEVFEDEDDQEVELEIVDPSDPGTFIGSPRLPDTRVPPPTARRYLTIDGRNPAKAARTIRQETSPAYMTELIAILQAAGSEVTP